MSDVPPVSPDQPERPRGLPPELPIDSGVFPPDSEVMQVRATLRHVEQTKMVPEPKELPIEPADVSAFVQDYEQALEQSDRLAIHAEELFKELESGDRDQSATLEKVQELVQTLKDIRTEVDRGRAAFQKLANPAGTILSSAGTLGYKYNAGVDKQSGLIMLNLNSLLILARRASDVASLVVTKQYLDGLAKQETRLRALSDTLEGSERETLLAEADKLQSLHKEEQTRWYKQVGVVGAGLGVSLPGIFTYAYTLFKEPVDAATKHVLWGIGATLALGLSAYDFHRARVMVRDQTKWLDRIQEGRAKVQIEEKEAAQLFGDLVDGELDAMKSESQDDFERFFSTLMQAEVSSVQQMESVLQAAGIRLNDINFLLSEQGEEPVAVLADLERPNAKQVLFGLFAIQHRFRSGVAVHSRVRQDDVEKIKSHLAEQKIQEEKLTQKVETAFRQVLEVISKEADGDLEKFREIAKSHGIDLRIADERLMSNKQDYIRSVDQITQRDEVYQELRRQFSTVSQTTDLSLRNALRASARQKQTIARKFLKIFRLDRAKGLVLSIASVGLFILSALAAASVITLAATTIPYISLGLFIAGLVFLAGSIIYMAYRKPNAFKVMASKEYVVSVFRELVLSARRFRLVHKRMRLASLQVKRVANAEVRSLELLHRLLEKKYESKLPKEMKALATKVSSTREKALHKLAEWSDDPERRVKQREKDLATAEKLLEDIQKLEKKVETAEARVAPVRKKVMEAQYRDYWFNVAKEGIGLSPDLVKKGKEKDRLVRDEDTLTLLSRGIVSLIADGSLHRETAEIITNDLGIDLNELRKHKDSEAWVPELEKSLKQYFATGEKEMATLAASELRGLRNEAGDSLFGIDEGGAADVDTA